MSREMAVIALGIWVVVLPHIGVPHSWSVVITTITGFLLIATGLYLRAAMLGKGIRRSSHHPFVENSVNEDGHTHEHHQEARG